jgi:hypothetical protein
MATQYKKMAAPYGAAIFLCDCVNFIPKNVIFWGVGGKTGFEVLKNCCPVFHLYQGL